MKSYAVSPGTGKPGAGRPADPLAAVAALVCIAAAVGCASSSSSTTTAPSSKAVTVSSSPALAAPGSTPAAAPSPTVTPPPTAPPACRTSTLTVKLGLSQGYAGGVYQVISFTNASNAACTLYGYPGVSLVTSPPYTQVGLAAERDTTAPVKLVTLAPGAAATAVLQVVDALNFPASDVQPGPGDEPAGLPAEPDGPGLPCPTRPMAAPSRCRPCSSARCRPTARRTR